MRAWQLNAAATAADDRWC